MERKNDTEQPMLNYPEMHQESNRESKQKIKVARKTSTNKKIESDKLQWNLIP